jgi:hypothetical protein
MMHQARDVQTKVIKIQKLSKYKSYQNTYQNNIKQKTYIQYAENIFLYYNIKNHVQGMPDLN